MSLDISWMKFNSRLLFPGLFGGSILSLSPEQTFHEYLDYDGYALLFYIFRLAASLFQ